MSDHPIDRLRALAKQAEQDCHDSQVADSQPELDLPAMPVDLTACESTVARSRLLTQLLWRAVKRLPEYRRQLATTARHQHWQAEVRDLARTINAERLHCPLQPVTADQVADRVTGRIATWSHAPTLQRERQRKAVEARRRKNRSRDQLIIHMHLSGSSNSKIASHPDVGMKSKESVRKVIRRENCQCLTCRSRHAKPLKTDTAAS